MKKFFTAAFLLLSALAFIQISCVKKPPCEITENSGHAHQAPGKPSYSTVPQFRQGLENVAQLIYQHRIKAYRDTLRNGDPDRNGRWIPLVDFVAYVFEKLDAGLVDQAVYDVFHFDGETFSLISYLMKAEMVGDISHHTLTTIVAAIPLPPLAVVGFVPPLAPVILPELPCDCEPKVKIKVSWAYKPACGNYESKVTGYAANNTLTNMRSGVMYRFDAEVSGCAHGGTWTQTVTAPAGASYGYSSGGGGSSVNFIGESAGAYTITFKYTCSKCNKTAEASFTLTIR